MARLIAFGTIPGDSAADETFSCGIHVSESFDGSLGYDFWADVFTAPGSRIPQRAVLLGVRYYADSATKALYTYYAPSPVTGADEGTGAPSFTTSCVTFESDLPGGAGIGYNRCFPPNFGPGIQSATPNLITVDTASLMASAMAVALTDHQSTIGPVVVWKGVQHQIDRVAVDTVRDTQRRRKFQTRGTRTYAVPFI